MRFKNVTSLFGPFFGVLLIGYFTYHLVQGERGLLAWVRLEKEVKNAESLLAQLKTKNDFLTNKISGLKSNSLDLDLLEEQSRSLLGYADPSDVIVLLPEYQLSAEDE